MKKLATQFDSQKHGVYVTTPSCCGCCCCCCCSLATSITSSTLLARRINHEAKVHNTPHRGLYVAMAALFLPIAGFISYLLVMFVDNTFEQCRTYSTRATSYSVSRAYEVCTGSATNAYWIIIGLVFIGFLAFLYSMVKMSKPVGRAILAVAAIAILLVAEIWVGAMLILTSAGIGYLLAIPFLFGIVYKLYDVTFGKDIRQEKNAFASPGMTDGSRTPSISPAYPDDPPAAPTENSPSAEKTDDSWQNPLK